MQRTVETIKKLFARGIIPQSNPHFDVQTLPDMRQRLTVKSNLIGAGIARTPSTPRPLLVQTVAHILYSTEGRTQTRLNLDTGALQGGNNIVGNPDEYLTEVRAIDEHPYSVKALLAYWFGLVPINGVFIYLDTIKNRFPDLTSFTIDLDSEFPGVALNIVIYHGGRNYHSGSDLINQGGELLQELDSDVGLPVTRTLTWDFTTSLATLV